MSERAENPTQENVYQPNWVDYYQAVENRPPRPTLLNALDAFEGEITAEQPFFAIDLGCGEGRDTVELLRRGWKVLGIDGEAEGINRLLSRPDLNPENLETEVCRFEVLELPANGDLINASFSIIFCLPEAFPQLWEKIENSLRKGGRFCGQLLGERDTWASYTSTNAHTREQIEQLLTAFDVELLEEEEHPGKTALGVEKYWHLFHIVARKR